MKNESNIMQFPSFDGRVPAELSADYILPDTYPDVKRILRVDAKPVLIGRYVSGRRLEFSGAVDYIVLFCADGESGAETLHSVHFAGEWNGAVGELDELDVSEVVITPRISACSARLSNPRKLTIRSTVAADVRITRPVTVSPRTEGALTMEEELRLERLTEIVPSLRERTFIADSKQISENLEPDASQPAIDEIIICDAAIRFHEVKPTLGGGSLTVQLKGEALVSCIYKAQSEAGAWRSFRRKLPLSYVVGADEFAGYFSACRPESICASAVGTPVEINASVGENSYGERRVVELDMSFDIGLHICGDCDLTPVLDAYSTERGCECVSRDLDLSSVGKILGANFSVGESVSREELGIPEGASVIDAAADVTLGNLTLDGRGRAFLSGEAALSCIFIDADGHFFAAEPVIPVRCELNVGDLSEPVSMVCDCSVSDLRTRFDSERMYCDFEVSLTAELMKRSRRSALEVIRLFGEPKRAVSDSSMTLCYPAADESLWQIAKRYGTTTAAIEAANPDRRRVIVIPTVKAVSKVI